MSDRLSIADLGSGQGRLLWVVARLGHRAIGLEIDPRLVEISQGDMHERMPDADYYLADQSAAVLARLPLRAVGRLELSLHLPNSVTQEHFVVYERTDL